MNKLKHSPFVMTTIAEYLEEAGYEMDLVTLMHATFTKGDTQLVITNDVMIIKYWYEGDNDRHPAFYESNRINHISEFDELDWLFLLHALKVVRVDELYKSVSKGSGAAAAAVKDMLVGAM